MIRFAHFVLFLTKLLNINRTEAKKRNYYDKKSAKRIKKKKNLHRLVSFRELQSKNPAIF